MSVSAKNNQNQLSAEVHDLGPVVQSVVSLMSSLVAKTLTVLVSVLVSTISNYRIFLLKKCKSYSHFFSKNINV